MKKKPFPMKKTPFKMDPDVYDTLDGMAQFFGGVGKGNFFIYGSNTRLAPVCGLGFLELAPVCGLGFLEFAGATLVHGQDFIIPFHGWVKRFGFNDLTWDVAVVRVMRRYPNRITVDQYGVERVPLKLVLKELNIIRGED